MLFNSAQASKLNWFFPSLIAVLLAVGLLSSLYIYDSVTDANEQSLVSRAQTIAYALEAENIAALRGSEEDLGTDIYEDLKQKMIAIRESNNDSQFVYLMGRRDGEVFFYVDSEPADSEDYSPPGQVYFEESPAIQAGFVGGIASVEGPTTDRWGTWITGIAPIFDEEGKVAAVAGIDIDAGSYIKSARRQAAIPFLIACVLALFAYFGNKLRRREQELLNLKAQFVALATHEIRSPLAGIVWSLGEFAKRHTIAGTDLEPIEKASARLIESVNDILFSFSLETNQLKKEKLSLREVLALAMNDLKAFAEKKKVKVHMPQIGDLHIRGDKNGLVHVFANIISNAIKYSVNGAEVSITESHTSESVHITVIDHGIGIPDKDKQRIFEGFFRSQNAKAHADSGTGLGLYIVEKVISAHHGKIWVESEEGKRTKMHIELPLVIL